VSTDPQPSQKKPILATVAKTRVFDLIGRLSTDPDALQPVVEALRNGTSLIEAGVLGNVIEDDEQRKAHIGAHWIGGDREQRILAQALVRAGELALQDGVPIDAYWVFAGDQFEAAVCRSQQQVTVLVVTPYPNVPTEGEAPPDTRIDVFC
jgi:hypothetical protein